MFGFLCPQYPTENLTHYSQKFCFIFTQYCSTDECNVAAAVKQVKKDFVFHYEENMLASISKLAQ